MKVGILTHYYGSRNYGGVLQAYALTTYLKNLGYEAEQICYIHSRKPFDCPDEGKKDYAEINSIPSNIFNRITCRVKGKIRSVVFMIKQRKRNRYNQYFSRRAQKFDLFIGNIPHSPRVYETDTISTADGYDAYITGSDQVWNFQWFNPAFFLDNIAKQKRKIAYAASAGKSIFSENEEMYLSSVLPDYYAISVRENSLKDALSQFGHNIEYVLDPVFLLSENEWNSLICKRNFKRKYIFSFFLGNDSLSKKKVADFAKKKGLTLITIPFVGGWNEIDLKLKGPKINDAGPQDFLSLIKYSEYVFTDSFHCTAFSLLFKKEVIAFGRINESGMNSRIENLFELLQCQNHFFSDSDSFEYDDYSNLPRITYTNNQHLLKIIEHSKQFLTSALEMNGDDKVMEECR